MTAINRRMPMRLSHTLIIAGALVAATPALAQDNAAATTNTTTVTNTTVTNTMDANAMAAEADMNSAAVPPESTNASPGVATSADTGTTMGVKKEHGFPWGVLGLLGLVGLMGVRKVKS
jgi:hypothetical protein